MPDHPQAHPHAPPISPSRPLLQHCMPGVPAMLMPVLSASRVPATLDRETKIYRPSRDDNGHRRTSTSRKYSNFTSCAPCFCINRLLFTFLTIRRCQFTIYCLSRSLGRSFLIEVSPEYCQRRSTASASLCHFVTRPHRRDVWYIFPPTLNPPSTQTSQQTTRVIHPQVPPSY